MILAKLPAIVGKNTYNSSLHFDTNHFFIFCLSFLHFTLYIVVLDVHQN